jgi:hypothetical protein
MADARVLAGRPHGLGLAREGGVEHVEAHAVGVGHVFVAHRADVDVVHAGSQASPVRKPAASGLPPALVAFRGVNSIIEERESPRSERQRVRQSQHFRGRRSCAVGACFATPAAGGPGGWAL